MNKLLNIIFILLTFINFLFSQSISNEELKMEYDSDDKTGNCKIINKTKSIGKGKAITTFTVEIPFENEYYLSAFVMGSKRDGKLNKLLVRINEDNSLKTLKFQKAKFHMATLIGKDGEADSIKLEAGKNKISFIDQLPFIPHVEFIRITKDKNNIDFKPTKYEKYVDKLRNYNLPSNYSNIKKEYITDNADTKSDSKYQHALNKTFEYSFYKEFYFYSSTIMTFETKKDNPYASDPVIHFFHKDAPLSKGTWTNDNGGAGYQSKLNVSINNRGWYCLYIRAYPTGNNQGTSDLYINGSLYMEEIPFNNFGIRCDHSISGELNYFTGHTSGDSRIWIEDQTGLPGRIVAWNDDYNGTGDFNWGDASRVKESFPVSIRSTHVTASNASNPSIECDVYMNYENDGRYYFYDNFEADDDIKSAEADIHYNCYAWAGGITNECIDPVTSIYGVDLSDAPDTLTRALYSFDNYLGNIVASGDVVPRYEGAFVYSRTGATYENADLDLWHRDRNTFSDIMWKYTGGFTHLSVNSEHSNSYKTPPNNHPHGFAWESKAGTNVRFFHPRHALYSPGEGEGHYGEIDKHYKWTGEVAVNGQIVDYTESSKSCFTLKESIDKGYTIIKTIKFKKKENHRIEELINNLSNKTINNFMKKYIVWSTTWKNQAIKFQSNIRAYANSNEYNHLLKFCQKEGKKVLPLIFKKFDNPYIINLISDLTINEYKELMEEVKKERINNLYNDKGVFIYLSNISLWKKYCKKIIEKSDFKGSFINVNSPSFNRKSNENKDIEGINSREKNIPSEYVLNSNYPNPFNPTTTIKYVLPQDGYITLKVYDITGKEIAVMVRNKYKNKGPHTVKWNALDKNGNSVPSGIYFYKLQSGNTVKTKKMILMR